LLAQVPLFFGKTSPQGVDFIKTKIDELLFGSLFGTSHSRTSSGKKNLCIFNDLKTKTEGITIDTVTLSMRICPEIHVIFGRKP
jgi:hypothetical protein